MSRAPTIHAHDAFRDAIAASGLTPPDEIVADGKLHRYPSSGRRDDDAGFYVFHDDGIPAGAFGCWRAGINETWAARSEHTLTDSERAQHRARIAALKRQREEEERRRHAEAAAEARRIWEAATPANDDHPYLTKKKVHAHGLRLHHDSRLIVPVRDADGVLSSLEFIGDDGGKLFLFGGRVAGCLHLIGDPTDVLMVAEGYATAASIHEATGYPVAVAFSAGNLLPAAKALRTKYPQARIVVAGDHDANGTGQAEAREAAEAVGGIVALPEEHKDWNDVATKDGSEAVRNGLAAVLRPSGCVLDDVHAFLGRFVAYPSEHAHNAHALWVAHTHMMDAWESTPRLAFLSPEPSSGKTRALEITETLVPRPVEAINATPAYLFRKVSDPAGLPTILYDEIDTLFGPKAKEHEEIRGIINAGHRRGAMAGRCVVKGKRVETEELPAFCAVALAGIGNLPDTILSRSVVVKMRRRAPDEVVEPYRRRLHAPEGHALRDRLATWAAQNRPTLNPWPSMPEGITDRPADVWEALLAVADAAGGEWPDRARVSAVTLVTDARGGTPSLGVRLLADLRVIFGEHKAMPTTAILESLTSLEEAPWGDLKGKPLDARRLASLLRPYGISRKAIRTQTGTAKGYLREGLHDAWIRYLPPSDPGHGNEPDSVPSPTKESVTSVTTETDGPFDEADLFQEDGDAP